MSRPATVRISLSESSDMGANVGPNSLVVSLSNHELVPRQACPEQGLILRRAQDERPSPRARDERYLDHWTVSLAAPSSSAARALNSGFGPVQRKSSTDSN